MKISIWDSALNVLKGTVKQVDMKPEEPEITLEIAPGVEIISAMPRDLAEKLRQAEGKEAYLTIDASDVIIFQD